MIIPLIVAVLYYWMIFFLWMNMICCTLKHLWSSLFLRKTIQMEEKKQTPSLCYSHPVSDLQTFDITRFCYGHYCHLWFLWPWISQTWLSNLNMMLMQTYFYLSRWPPPFPSRCMDYAHCWCSPCWFISAFITSISDCLLSQQDLVSNIRTDVVDQSYSDS